MSIGGTKKPNTDESLVNMRGFVEGDTGTTDWWATGQHELNKYLQQTLPWGVAKNVILFVGDGMGVFTVSAGRIYKAQSRNLMGDDALLSFEKFPHVGISKVNCNVSMMLFHIPSIYMCMYLCDIDDSNIHTV